MRTKLSLLVKVSAGLLGLLALTGSILGLSACTAMGTTASGDRLVRMQNSAQWREGSFKNTQPTLRADSTTLVWAALTESSDYTTPDTPLPIQHRQLSDYAQPPGSGLRVTWLGHSNMLVEIDGQRVLIDPIWGQRASPISWLGPERWYESPLALAQLPDIDAIIISHDHYDHLDHSTVLALLPRQLTWLVPLGVGAHLQGWGVQAEHIVEMDWWQSHQIGQLTFTATPARHFSGRSPTNRDQNGGPTLWAGWSIAGPSHTVYYSGDTALFEGMKEIGERLGPFDLTMIETGAYNAMWRDVHLGPEQAVRAHQLVKGKVLMPVHWGLFNLSLHGWTEPMERLLVAAAQQQVTVLGMQPGAMAEPALAAKPPRAVEQWWPDLPWQSVLEAPVVSSGVEHLMAQ